MLPFLSAGLIIMTSRRTAERIKRYALEKDARRAKFAARFLTFTPEKDEICNEIVQVILSSSIVWLLLLTHVILQIISSALTDTDEDTLVSHLTVLNQFVQFYPESFESKSDVIIAALARLLRQPTSSDSVNNSAFFLSWKTQPYVLD
jgi:sister chromatid cohesion protein PDS5